MDGSMFIGTWWSLVPPVLAIVLALVTKEVYSSLFIGVAVGALLYTGFHPWNAFVAFFDIMKDSMNLNILIFDILLGMIVVLMAKSGGSAAYGNWAGTKIKSKRSALLATTGLGILIFVDDYFNCLTVGSVMRPVTDRFKVSRAKLAYIIDATAAPVCIIAPISSWAVAVASEVEEAGGLNAFVRTIPYNLYAILTIVMVFALCFTDFDFGPMEKAEAGREERRTGAAEETLKRKKGTVLDLALPVVTLIVCAILGMAYVGGFFAGTGKAFTEAIGENPTAGLTLGTFAALVVALALYLPRRIMGLREFMTGIIDGIKTMIPALTILILAWGLGGVCREMIGTGIFVSHFVSAVNLPFGFLPAIVFAVAAFLSFSMGTAWGTFGILLPIVSMMCAGGEGAAVLIPALGATLAGSVYGDHCSPISDTTILASTGAQCEHLRHVETQLPYATLVAAVCFFGYLVAGFSENAWITILSSVVLLLGALGGIAFRGKRRRGRGKH